jgi:hypothetical protein
MDILLELLKARPRENWRWTLNPKERAWSRDNALALANCALLAYSDSGEIIKQLEARQFQTIIPCNSDHHPADTQAYVAVCPDAVIVAFRGTEPTNWRDFMTDFSVGQIPFERTFHFSDWGRIHKGWADGVDAVLKKIESTIKSYDDGSRSLWITGHSLGGALAMVAAAFLSKVVSHHIAGVYTFGQPRVGDSVFRDRYNKALGAITFRCVNDQDLVPHLPPRTLTKPERGVITSISHLSIVEFAGALIPSEGVTDQYEHAGQVRLLLPSGQISNNFDDEVAREPEFLAHLRTARSLVLDLPKLLLQFRERLFDHLPINPHTLGIDHDGYVERIEALS